MRRKNLYLAAVGVAVTALGWALAVLAQDSAAPFAGVDTHGHNAVTLELIKDGQSFAKILVLENEMGAVRFGDGKGTLGLVPEEISLRGDSVRLAVYELQSYRDAETGTGKWVEDLDLARGSTAVAAAKAGQRAGEPSFQIRVLDVKLADR